MLVLGRRSGRSVSGNPAGADTHERVLTLGGQPSESEPVALLLFSKTTTDVQKRERLFMITPKIVPSALSLAAKQ